MEGGARFGGLFRRGLRLLHLMKEEREKKTEYYKRIDILRKRERRTSRRKGEERNPFSPVERDCRAEEGREVLVPLEGRLRLVGGES